MRPIRRTTKIKIASYRRFPVLADSISKQGNPVEYWLKTRRRHSFVDRITLFDVNKAELHTSAFDWDTRPLLRESREYDAIRLNSIQEELRVIAYFQIRARSCQSTRSNFNGKFAWIGISYSRVQLFGETEGDVYGARVSFNLKCLNALCSL